MGARSFSPPCNTAQPWEEKTLQYYFGIFIFLHTLLWTLGPAFLRPTLPHDTLEGITWGLQWQWGYNKHPFLTAWLCAGISRLFSDTSWSVYFLAQLCVSLTFIVVWRLALHMLSKTQALIAALALEGVFFYNINSFNITPDTLQSPLWALLCLFFYKALTQQKLVNWLMLSFIGALCFCAKYQVVIIFFLLFSFTVINPYARQSFKKPGIYCALILFLILITPHLIWLYEHQFITLFYAKGVSAEYTLEKSLLSYLVNPSKFFINSLLNVAGIFILLWPFYSLPFASIQNPKDSFNKQFLFLIALGPFIVTLIACLLTGDYFPSRWATPYFFALSLLLLTYLNPLLNKKNITQFLLTLTLFSSLLFFVRISTFVFFPRPESDAFLPNKNIALMVNGLWTSRYHRPLPYLAGSHYLVAGILPYLPNTPIPYLSWDKEDSAWVNEQQLHRQGGIFIWDVNGFYTWDRQSKIHRALPAEVLKRFPTLQLLPNLLVPRLSDQQIITIGVAVLPPESEF